MIQILVIDDEGPIRNLLARMIELEGYKAVKAADCQSALVQMKTHRFDVVLCDVFLPDGNGVEFITEIRKCLPEAAIILLTTYWNIADGVQAIKNGAFDYITKGDDNRKIIPTLSRAVEEVEKKRGKAEALPVYSFHTITGHSACLQQTVKMAQKVAATDVPVLLTGETGTGKEVFAHAIHADSNRFSYSIVDINCSAFSKDLLESELFGYKAGAFTGAVKDKNGLFEVAHHGTLFLDEIGEMAFFISTISHELKTPISAILMSLQLLEDSRIGHLNEEQKELTKSIQDNSDRLLSITSELLNMTQVESGKLQLKPRVTKPIELIEYAIKANRVQAEKFNIQVEVDYPKEKIGKLFVDSEKIAWVLTNLLSNAIRYSVENGRIIIGARQLGDEYVEF